MKILFYFIMMSKPLLTHFFCSSEILKSFKAKPQSKSIQWFNFSYMGKTNRKSETNIIANFTQFFDNYDVTPSCVTSKNY